MKNAINIDKFIRNKINEFYGDYLEKFKDREHFYDIVIDKINESVQKNKCDISVFIERRLCFDKIFEHLEEELKEIEILICKEREYYSIYINKVSQLKKLNDFYLKLKEEKPMSEEEFIKERQFLFK